MAHIDPSRLSVDGVMLGMTGGQVVSVLGKPLEDDYDGDTVRWTYGRSTTTVTLLFDARDNPSVISVEGRQLAVGERSLVPQGTNQELAMQRLAALGQPEIEENDGHCGFFALGFEGILTYRCGLTLYVDDDDVRSIGLKRPETTPAFRR